MYYGNLNALGRNFMGSRIDPDGAAYVAAVVAAGGTVDAAQATAVDTFYKSAKADGYYTSLKRLYLPIWGVAAANAIDMIGLTSGTFVGGVTHAAGYVQGNGSTGYFNWGISPRTLGISASIGCVFGLTYIAPSVGQEIARAIDAVQTGIFSNGTTILGLLSDYTTGYSQLSATAANQVGIIYSTRTSNAYLVTKRLRTAGLTSGTPQTATNAVNSAQVNFYSFAANAGGPTGFTNQGMGLFGSAVFSSIATADTAMVHLKNLWEETTVLTLP